MNTVVDTVANTCTMEEDPSSAADNAPEVGTDACEALRGADAPGEAMQVAEAKPSSEGDTTRALHPEAPAVEAAMAYKLRSSTAAEPETSQEVGVEKTPVRLPSESELVKRLEFLCVGGEGPPTVSSGRVPDLAATNELIKLVIDVVFGFFKVRKEDVRWVTEKAQLDKFDGVAYLLADLLRGELLLEEAITPSASGLTST